MRNSSLVECSCAENVTGLKPITEAADSPPPPPLKRGGWGGMVEEHSLCLRRRIVRTAGDMGRDSAGISSDKRREKRLRHKPKGSWAMLIIPG